MSQYQKGFGLIALIAIAIWAFVVFPLIDLPSDRFGELPAKAPVLTAVVACLALIIASGQLYLNRQNQRETTAKANFRDFLKLCVEYPEYAYGRAELPDDTYAWFVAHFLWAAEEILEYAPREWERNLKLHVRYHRNYLKKDQRFVLEELPTYTPRLQRFLEETLK